MTQPNRNDLLRQLKQLGYHPSGRKIRADKNAQHNYPNKRIPQDPSTLKNTKVSIYRRVKTKVMQAHAKDIANGGVGIYREVDENGYYIVIPASYVNKGQTYIQVYQGRRIEHTTRRVRTQKEIDLEQYRFEAYREQYILFNEQTVDESWYPEICNMLITRYSMTGDEAYEAIRKRKITWREYFCEFYHLEPRTAHMWSYEHWRRDYHFIPVQLLPDDFEFNYESAPGTDEFHPEWKWKRDKVLAQEKLDQETEEKRKIDTFSANINRNKRRK